MLAALFLIALTFTAVLLIFNPTAFAAPGAAPAPGAGADDTAPTTIDWKARAESGAAVAVPAADRPSIVIFARADQAQSDEALRHVAAVMKPDALAQVVLVFSGPRAAQAAGAAGESGVAWPIVVDPEYTASGQMAIHVWPTVLVVNADGVQVAHLAGMPNSFARDLQANLDFAAGKIDEEELHRRMTDDGVLASSHSDRAGRHLHIALRLLARGSAQEAKSQIDAGLELAPDDPALTLALARAMIALGQPAQAMTVLDGMTAGSVPAWQVAVVRMRALIALERWEDAKAAVDEALRLNPKPGEAHYLIGLIHEHAGDFPAASSAYRRAYESAVSKEIP